MGGNAFGPNKSVRLNKAEYLTAADTVSKVLRQFPITFDLIQSYRSKDSFGDMDIIYTTDIEGYSFVDEFLKQIYGLGELLKSDDESTNKVLAELKVVNGPVTSVLIPTKQGTFQVDFIRVKKETYNFSYHYFNYNDLGNFLGRVFHKAGFKLGHDGLKYVVRINETQVLAELLVTPLWLSAMQFMGYDRYFSTTFHTVEDLFQFALSSPYANKDIFLLENRNHTSRVRDRKRKNYSMLLSFLNDPETKCENFDWSDKERLQREFLHKAFYRWTSFREDYERVFRELKEREDYKSKLNGEVVQEVTGLRGKELGQFMSRFKEFFGPNLKKIVMESDQEQVRGLVQYYRTWYG